MNDSKSEGKAKFEDVALSPVPLENRQNWITPAVIFGGLEFCVPVLMIGASLIGAFGLMGMIPVVLVTFLVFTWGGNAVCGYIGAKTGLSSSVIARQGFGDKQAKFIIAIVIGVVSMGWWAIQTAVTGNALCVILGIDYTTDIFSWAVVTTIVGILFALPSISGFTSMKWTDYLAVPCGLILCIFGIYLAFSNVGWDAIVSYEGSGDLTFFAGITTLLGLNVSQFVIAADYTRYAKPRWKDNILIPLGIIGVGVPLCIVGGVMAAGNGTADIVAVMQNLGFPVWGFIVLWLASWTSQLVNNYTMGLSFANILNIDSNKGRIVITCVGTVISIALALAGILNYFMDLLTLSSLLYPGIAAVIFVDFFMRKGTWKNRIGWNYVATIALVLGAIFGYITTYVFPIGIPPIQSLALAAVIYYFGMKAKAKIAPDQFTEGL